MPRLSTKERKEQIAIAILEIIGNEGLDNLSMPALAKRLDIVPSALYRHFSSKEEMISAGLDLLKLKIMDVFDRHEADSDNALEPLKRFLDLHRQFFHITTVFPRIAFSLADNETFDLRRQRMQKFHDTVLERISATLEKGRRNGQLRKNLDTSAAALSFWGILVSSTLRWFITGGNFDVEAYKKEAWDMFVRAVSK
jgi:AcrR family transcriptional regulator